MTSNKQAGLTLAELLRPTSQYGLATTTRIGSDTMQAKLTIDSVLDWLIGQY